MTSTQEIILFDLASKDGNKCWSYNPWKTRLVLAYKSIPYTTEFLDYPDIATRLSPHLTAEEYTIPTIQYTDGRYIMDSKRIAETLERDHPTPSLHLDSPYLAKMGALPVLRGLRPHLVPLVPTNLLREGSLEYFHRTRKEALGMTLEEFAQRDGQDGFAAAAPDLRQVTAWLKENPEGPYFMGKEVSYADFVWAGILLFAWRIDPQGKFEELLTATGDAEVHRALLKALEPLSARMDH